MFIKTLLCGVLKKNDVEYVYEDPDGKKKILFDGAGRFYNLPLYQSYVSFKGLDETTQKYLTAQAEIILNEHPVRDSTLNACRQIWSDIRDMKRISQISSISYHDEMDDICEFYCDLNNELTAFASTYSSELN